MHLHYTTSFFASLMQVIRENIMEPIFYLFCTQSSFIQLQLNVLSSSETTFAAKSYFSIKTTQQSITYTNHFPNFSGAFILCWLPYFTLFMVVAYCGNDQCVNPTVFTITIWFGYFNSTLNPILYPLCNANFKTAFKRMLRFESPRSADQVILNGVQYHHQAPNGTNGNISNLPSKRV